VRTPFLPVKLAAGILLFLPANMVAAALVQNRRRRSTPAPASTSLFVSKTGSDANDGLSSGAPVLTFATAMSKALSNAAITTIIAQGVGTWAETLTYTRNGLTTQFTGGGIIDGGAARPGVDFGGKDDCGIVGATIQNTVSDSYAVVGTAAHRALIDTVTILNCPRGIFMLSSTGVIIRSSVIHDANTRHGIELRTCTGALIQDVETYLCAGRGVYLYGTSASTVRRLYTHDNGSSNYGLEMEAFGSTLSDGNLVVDSWAGVTTGAQKYGFIDKLGHKNMELSNFILALLAILGPPLAWYLKPRFVRMRDQTEAHQADFDLLRDQYGWAATEIKAMRAEVSQLRVRQDEYELHIDDWHQAAAQEPDGGAAIRARLRTRRPGSRASTQPKPAQQPAT
jgi:hypothetical protein